MKKIIIILIFLININNSYAIDTTIVRYFPLVIGNVWVYNWHSAFYPGSVDGICKCKIVNSFIANGKKYFGFQNSYTFPLGYYCGAGFLDSLRIDSVSGNIYQYMLYSNSECLFDSLKAKINDTIRNLCNYSYIAETDTSSGTIFGQNKQSKKFSVLDFETFIYRKYFKDFGLYNWYFGQNSVSCSYILKGCVINGISYGDTSFPVGIIQISTNVPKEFHLYQNYPNPFNPTTKIKFSIPTSPSQMERGPGGEVKLIIYDILGREVAALVNEKLNPGTYEVEFNGANYPSGVYFYKLIAADYTETKKLILLK